MKILEGQTALFDVDDTLILWDKSQYPDSPHVTILNQGLESTLPVHTKQLNLMVKLAKIGYQIVVWSRSGDKWARAVVETLLSAGHLPAAIEGRITIMSKPTLFVDDQKPEVWLGEHVYREPSNA